MRVVVLGAWRELRRIQREAAARAELPIANALALYVNGNRDTKARPEPFSIDDFTLFHDKKKAQPAISAEVAAVALRLRNEDKASPLLLGIWPQLLDAANDTPAPSIATLCNDDHSIWILAPRWEGHNIRGGLIVVQGQVSGPCLVRDLDRPLNAYRVVIPERRGFGWIEANLLLVSEN